LSLQSDVIRGHLALSQSQQQKNNLQGWVLQGRKHIIRAAQQPLCKCNMHKNTVNKEKLLQLNIEDIGAQFSCSFLASLHKIREVLLKLD
jgi:hypothetical protein